MKLMLLVSDMNSGGAERVAATLCNAWVARRDEVTLVATYSGRGGCAYALDRRVRLIYLADVVAVTSGKRGANRGHGRAGYLGRLLALRRLIRETGPEVVTSLLTNVNIFAVIATFGLRIPLILGERVDPVAERDSTWFWKVLRRFLYPLADIVTVQTLAGIGALRSCVPAARRIEAVPNPIPEQLFETHGAPAGPGERRRLVAMGRLASQKQWHHLIDVFAAIAPSRPDVDLWIWGEGNLRAELERQVAGAGLAGRVFLPGRTASPWQEMAAADAFVLTSAYEGFPNVLLEAMALGLPCIAYDCPSGPREMSEDGRAAILVRLDDRTGLQRELDTLLADPAARQRLGKRAADSVKARYRLAAVLARWDEIISAARCNHAESWNDLAESGVDHPQEKSRHGKLAMRLPK